MHALDNIDGFDHDVADVAAVKLIGLPVEAASVRVAEAVRTDLGQTCDAWGGRRKWHGEPTFFKENFDTVWLGRQDSRKRTIAGLLL